MPTIIVNADDFGLTRGVNYGILDSHLNGIVASTTMLVNMPGTHHAVSIAKDYPQLGVGVHLALTIGKPVLKSVASLVGESGRFRQLQEQRNKEKIDLEDVLKEWTAQIETFYGYGLKPTHLDSHHHMHSWSYLLPVVERLSQKYGLPWRNHFEIQPNNIRFASEVFDARFYKDGVSEDSLEAILTEHGDKESIEIMCHPGYIDSGLFALSSYTAPRTDEVDILTSYKLPEYCRTSKVRF